MVGLLCLKFFGTLGWGAAVSGKGMLMRGETPMPSLMKYF